MYGYDQESQWTYLTVGIIIIAFLLSIIVPFSLMTILQDMFHFSRSHWIFMAPLSAYFTFGASFIWVALLLTFFLIVKFKREKLDKKAPVWMIIAGMPIALLFLVLSINNYYFFQEEGITFNPLLSFNAQHYQWEDIESVKQVYEKNQGTVSLKDTVFRLRNGTELVFNYHPDFWEYQDAILTKAREAGAITTDNLTELTSSSP